MIGHFAIGIPEMDAIGIERCSQCTARVPGRWRHKDALESGFSENSRVGQTVQRHSATKAEVG